MTAKPNSQPSPRAREKPLPNLQTLRAILDDIGSPPWDLLLVGDGSGVGWKDACGWATVMVDRRILDPQLFVGGASHGSITLAEQIPYLHALLYHYNRGGKDQIKAAGPIQVHIVTDSQVTAANGNAASNPSEALPTACSPLWAAWRDLNARGYLCTFHWRGRSQSVLNWISDLAATHGRLGAKYANDPLQAEQLAELRRVTRQAAMTSTDAGIAQFAQLPAGQQAQYLRSVAAALQRSLLALSTPAEAPAQRIDMIDPLTTTAGESVPLREFLPDHRPT